MEIGKMGIAELGKAYSSGDLSPVEAVGAFLERIEALDPKLNCFITVEPERALEQARQAERFLAGNGGGAGPLTGVPLALKDNIVTRGLRTTCGSRILEKYRSPYDASVVKRLREAGAVVIGKTNCDEFAMGSSTENSAFFPTRNPWDRERVPGGSSGGSAAAVAAGLAAGALGSDTGGSIRQPAAFCGVVGMKPTYGRVSRYGLVAFGSSLDQIGPLANSVRDAALILQAIAGGDPCDATCSDRAVPDYSAELGRDPKGLRVGVPRQWFGTGLEASVENAVRAALKELAGLGCRLEEVDLFDSEGAVAVYYILAPAEASSNLARFDGVRYGFRAGGDGDLSDLYRRSRSRGFGPEVKRRIMIGTYVLSAGYIDAYYTKAAKVRRLLVEGYRRVFEKVDLLAGPTTPTPPFRIGEKADDPLAMYLSDVYTVTANLAGVPALSMPCGLTGEGLPIGLQLQAPAFAEGRLLRAAHALERHLDLGRPLPPV